MANILFFPGITITDVLELQKKLDKTFINVNETKYTSKTPEIIYEPLPSKFVSLNEDWPITTQLKCVMCTLKISNSPFPISKNFDKVGTKDIFTVLPHATCSAPCCALYIRKYLNDNDSYKYILKKIASIYYNINAIYEIPEAVSHTRLSMYGGDLSTKDFIEINKKIMKEYIKMVNHLN